MHDVLFEEFIENAKKNNYEEVARILNTSFDSAEKRAEFGNRKDDLGNTAYHYAAMYGCDDVIVVLNDKKKFNGKQKFISFVEVNLEGKTPLQLCCEAGHLSTFKLIWVRAGKTNHNPCYAIDCARLGGNQEIIQAIENHPKFPKATPAETKFTQGLKRFALQPVVRMDEAPKKSHQEESHGKRTEFK